MALRYSTMHDLDPGDSCSTHQDEVWVWHICDSPPGIIDSYGVVECSTAAASHLDRRAIWRFGQPEDAQISYPPRRSGNSQTPPTHHRILSTRASTISCTEIRLARCDAISDPWRDVAGRVGIRKPSSSGHPSTAVPLECMRTRTRYFPRSPRGVFSFW